VVKLIFPCCWQHLIAGSCSPGTLSVCTNNDNTTRLGVKRGLSGCDHAIESVVAANTRGRMHGGRFSGGVRLTAKWHRCRCCYQDNTRYLPAPTYNLSVEKISQFRSMTTAHNMPCMSRGLLWYTILLV
jgi:hypothetical protein